MINNNDKWKKKRSWRKDSDDMLMPYYILQNELQNVNYNYNWHSLKFETF